VLPVRGMQALFTGLTSCQLGDGDDRSEGVGAVLVLADMARIVDPARFASSKGWRSAHRRAQVAPEKGDHDLVRRQLLVRIIAVALHDPAIVREQLLEMLAASNRRVGVDDGRRIGSAQGRSSRAIARSSRSSSDRARDRAPALAARKGIGLELLVHQRRKSLHPFAEVHGFRHHQNPDRAWRNQHPTAHVLGGRTACKTASTSGASTPPGTRTLMAPITISMEAELRSCVALFACADLTDTTGTKGGIASAGSANCPTCCPDPVRQLLRCKIMPRPHVCNYCTWCGAIATSLYRSAVGGRPRPLLPRGAEQPSCHH
jgi:hypothetical protein